MWKSVKWLGITSLSLVLVSGITSCSEKEREGCTDPTAENYDVSATTDNGSCTFLDSTITIWSMGETGVWGESAALGAIELIECQGMTDTMTLNVDTAGNGDQALCILRDPADGNVFISARVINKQNALPFANGYLVFDAMLPVTSTLSSFNLFIHGNQCFEPVTCNGMVCISTPVEISTVALNDSAFSRITVPLTDFPRRYLQNSDVLFSIKDNHTGGGDTILYVKDVFWKTQP